MPSSKKTENVFKKFLDQPSSSAVLNSKLLLLTHGLDFSFAQLRQNFPQLKEKYKVNKIKVSDRHQVSTQSGQRDFIPDELILADSRNKSVCKVFYRPSSAFVLGWQEGEFIISEKDSRQEFPIKIEPVKLPNFSKLKYQDVYLDEFISVVGQDRLSIIPFDGCSNWPQGLPCLFCGANPSRLGFSGIKPDVYSLEGEHQNNCSQWWQAKKKTMMSGISLALQKFSELDELTPHFHFNLIGGNLPDMDFCWKLSLEVAELVREYIDLKKIDSHFNMMAPMNFKLIDRAKEIGFTNMDMNLECFDRSYFQKVCPGKAKQIGYQKIREALAYSLKSFGRGQVRSNFVLGAEPFSRLLAGAEELGQQGIVADYTIFFPRPGSRWHDKPTPDPNQVLDFTEQLVKIQKKHGLHPFCCSLSSRSSIANEVFDL